MKSILFLCLTLIALQSTLSQDGKARLSFGTKPDGFNASQKATDTPVRLKQPLDVAYPDSAMKKRMEGVVMVSAFISARGDVDYGEVEWGSGFRLLDSAALAVVRDGHFVAAQRNGKRVSARITIPVEFRLNRKEWYARSAEELEQDGRKVDEELQRLKEAQKKK